MTPQPITASHNPRLVHILMVQHSVDHLRATLTTTAEDHRYQHMAILLPRFALQSQVLTTIGLTQKCMLPTSTFYCSVWHGSMIFTDIQPFAIDNGFGLLIGIFPLMPPLPMSGPSVQAVPSSGPSGSSSFAISPPPQGTMGLSSQPYVARYSKSRRHRQYSAANGETCRDPFLRSAGWSGNTTTEGSDLDQLHHLDCFPHIHRSGPSRHCS